MYKPDFKMLDELTAQGYLRRVISPCGKLKLYNYTDKTTYDKKWNKHTLNARGTVYEVETGKVVARAFPKFFNFGELPASKSRNMLKRRNFEVFEKMDGSLGIVYFYDGEWRVNTRGSFTSDQAIAATKMLHEKYDTSKLSEDFVYMVEIIYPENRIIVDYGQEEKLTILAAFLHGVEVPFNTLFHCPFDLPKVYSFDSIEHVIETQAQLGKMEEGFVVRFSDGERVKFKSAEYLKVARVLSNMTPLAYWKAMKNGVVDKEVLEMIPEEFRDQSDIIKNSLENKYIKVGDEVIRDFYYCCQSINYAGFHTEDFKKPLGLLLKSEKLEHSGAMFPMLLKDSKGIEKYIMKEIRPKGNEFVV